MARSLVRLVACLALGMTACAPGAASRSSGGIGSVPGVTPRLSLTAAMREGRDLGPTGASTVIHLEAALAGRDTAALDALIARGVQVTPGEYAQRFGPSPQSVAAARQALAAQGLVLDWRAGDQLAALDGTAAAVQRVFGVALHDFAAPGGERFHAALGAPRIPAELRATITAVTGFDDWSRRHTGAIAAPHGVSPADMATFYDMRSVIGGADGSGLTMVLPEIDSFADSDLRAFASQQGLPAFNVDVHRDAQWGNPQGVKGEANMDLEIIHAFAPAARLIVYYSSPDDTQALRMLQALFSEQAGPDTIVSSSIGTCETPAVRPAAQQEEAIVRAAASKGTSIFVASGDRGAYDCLPEGDATTLATDLDGSLPDATSVGGTTTFLNQDGSYARETAWGEPVEQWGGNGGLSIFWPRPSWQVAPGTANQFSNGMRQVPDVSGNADAQSGWQVISGGAQHTIGGTSAAAPMWASLTALFDQVLIRQHHQTIGFANPGLYWMAQHASSLPAQPFHDITTGTNLYYPATAGWDFATGLGTPDAAALAADWPKYMESLGR
jgi:kumamolisin